jgi:hypothetical protein
MWRHLVNKKWRQGMYWISHVSFKSFLHELVFTYHRLTVIFFFANLQKHCVFTWLFTFQWSIFVCKHKSRNPQLRPRRPLIVSLLHQHLLKNSLFSMPILYSVENGGRKMLLWNVLTSLMKPETLSNTITVKKKKFWTNQSWCQHHRPCNQPTQLSQPSNPGFATIPIHNRPEQLSQPTYATLATIATGLRLISGK